MKIIDKAMELLGMPTVVRCARRDPKWHALEVSHLAVFPECVVCGNRDKKRKKQVHHIDPVHYAPEKELDPDNFATVCDGDCHLMWGHNGCYKYRNLNLMEDIATYRAKQDAARLEYHTFPFPLDALKEIES